MLALFQGISSHSILFPRALGSRRHLSLIGVANPLSSRRLYENQIGDAGAAGLGEGLKKNSALQELV